MPPPSEPETVEAAKDYWVVMALQSWSQVGTNLPYETSDRVPPGDPKNWLAVFDDRAEAEAWADGKPIARIQPVSASGGAE